MSDNSYPPVVINSRAGSVLNNSSASLGTQPASQFQDWIEENSAVLEIHMVAPDKMTRTVETLLDQGFKRVAVGGGDGTLSQTARLMIDAQAELVPLPLGTLNHFARDLNIPLDPDNWLQLLRSEHIIRPDLGQVNGRLFLNNVSAGWYPKMLQQRAKLDRERILGSKRLASLYSAIRMHTARIGHLHVSWEADQSGKSSAGKIDTQALLISNNTYASKPLALTSRETLESGHLTLYAPKEISPRSLTTMFQHILAGNVEECPDLLVCHAHKFKLELSRAGQKIAVDGELVDANKDIELESISDRLKVVVLDI